MNSEKKSLDTPDEVRTFENGKLELFQLGAGTVGRFVMQPGWVWSKHVKPIAGTEFCENDHFGYHLSGVLRVRMADGSEFEIKPGEIGVIGAGHDAWVVGNEPVISIDWTGAVNFGRP